METHRVQHTCVKDCSSLRQLFNTSKFPRKYSDSAPFQMANAI